MFSYSRDMLVGMGLTGVCSAVNMTCLTIAFQNDKTATVSLLAYIALVYAFLADLFIFKEQIGSL